MNITFTGAVNFMADYGNLILGKYNPKIVVDDTEQIIEMTLDVSETTAEGLSTVLEELDTLGGQYRGWRKV